MNGRVQYKVIALAAALGAPAAFGCASTTVKTDHDPRANLPAYKSFEVKSGKVVVNGIVDERDTLVRDRVESALTLELAQKGLDPTAQDPDLVATYTAGAVTGVDVAGWDYGGPYAGWGGDYNEGMLVIDLIDPKSNKLVWRATVEMNDSDDLRSAKKISAAVDKALAKYPGPQYGTT